MYIIYTENGNQIYLINNAQETNWHKRQQNVYKIIRFSKKKNTYMPLSKYVNLKKNKIEYENPFTDTETKWCLLTKVFHKK